MSYKCPKCGSNDVDEVETWYETNSPIPELRCNLCKYQGSIDEFEDDEE